MSGALGANHVHLAEVTSTNDHARELARRGAAHGTVVSADVQTSGRGRQGRVWSSPAGVLAVSIVLRPDHDRLWTLPLACAVAVAELCGEPAQIKWPNDVWLEPGRKVAGILIETRSGREGTWAVAGIGVNVAVDLDDLDPQARGGAATLGRPAVELALWRERLLETLERSLELDTDDLIAAWSERDGLLGRELSWPGGAGRARGIDGRGQLLVELGDGTLETLSAGEVHLAPVPVGTEPTDGA